MIDSVHFFCECQQKPPPPHGTQNHANKKSLTEKETDRLTDFSEPNALGSPGSPGRAAPSTAGAADRASRSSVFSGRFMPLSLWAQAESWGPRRGIMMDLERVFDEKDIFSRHLVIHFLFSWYSLFYRVFVVVVVVHVVVVVVVVVSFFSPSLLRHHTTALRTGVSRAETGPVRSEAEAIVSGGVLVRCSERSLGCEAPQTGCEAVRSAGRRFSCARRHRMPAFFFFVFTFCVVCFGR